MGDSDCDGEPIGGAKDHVFGVFGLADVGDAAGGVGELGTEEEDGPRDVDPEEEEWDESHDAVEVSFCDEAFDVEDEGPSCEHPGWDGDGCPCDGGGDADLSVGDESVSRSGDEDAGEDGCEPAQQ